MRCGARRVPLARPRPEERAPRRRRCGRGRRPRGCDRRRGDRRHRARRRRSIESALRAGKTVVTANKAVIAASGPRLAEVAAGAPRGAVLRGERSVRACRSSRCCSTSLLGDRIAALDCVINGTTNVILTQMRAPGVTFESALADAQQRGFAEADPSLDVDGWDAAHKLVILAWLALGVHVRTRCGRPRWHPRRRRRRCRGARTSSGTACASSPTRSARRPGAVHLQCPPDRGRPRASACATSMMLTMLSSSRATSLRT